MTNKNKYALTIGCSYKGTSMQLNGTINDAQNMSNLLKNMNYDVIFMNDNLSKTDKFYPNMNNILIQLKNILLKSKAGDDIVIFYAGHGIQTLSKESFEKDNKDEAIIPTDVEYDNKKKQYNNIIVDDTINKWLRSFSKKDTRIFLLFDCCHSGTMCDLKYTFDYKNNVLSYDESTNHPDDITNPIEATVITLSGCQDNEVSLETVIKFDGSNKNQGLLTSAFIYAIRTNPIISNDVFGLLKNILSRTKQYKQHPKISSNIALHKQPTNRYILTNSDKTKILSNNTRQPTITSSNIKNKLSISSLINYIK